MSDRDIGFRFKRQHRSNGGKQTGDQQCRGSSFAGNIADGEGIAAVRPFEVIVVVAAEFTAGLIVMSDFAPAACCYIGSVR